MAILIYGEIQEGAFKKSTFEAATYAHKLGQAAGDSDIHALVIGECAADELNKLGQYGVGTIHHLNHPKLQRFNSMAYGAAFVAAAEATGASHIVISQSYDGRAMAPRVAVKLEAALLSGLADVPTKEGESWVATRVVFSNKGIQTVKTTTPKVVHTVRGNAMMPEENPTSANVQAFEFEPGDDLFKAESVELNRRTDQISLVDAEYVVSAGRGLKGPENWGMVEELAELLGAATACSKPVADIEWRPHHEHVGQTGVQIAPNLYIAIGISGAIQHLAGVSASKTIVVINKDPDAPFFKAADYAIVGDAFDVVPKLIDKLKAKKGA